MSTVTARGAGLRDWPTAPTPQVRGSDRHPGPALIQCEFKTEAPVNMPNPFCFARVVASHAELLAKEAALALYDQDSK